MSKLSFLLELGDRGHPGPSQSRTVASKVATPDVYRPDNAAVSHTDLPHRLALPIFLYRVPCLMGVAALLLRGPDLIDVLHPGVDPAPHTGPRLSVWLQIKSRLRLGADDADADAGRSAGPALLTMSL